MRGSRAVRIVPKLADEYDVVGLAKLAWFRMLKNSARNCRLKRSEPIGMRLNRPVSQLMNLGPVSAPFPPFPYVPAAGVVNADLARKFTQGAESPQALPP